MKLKGLSLLLIGGLLSGCTAPDKISTPKKEQLKIDERSFSDLPGWELDKMDGVFAAFLKSCKTLLRQPATRELKPKSKVGDFHTPCRAAQSIEQGGTATKRRFFESRFTPYQVSLRSSDETEGLFTGYYEASLNGALSRYGPYQTPLYGLPRDLYRADLGQWYEELAGKKITARVNNGELSRYPDHAEISKNGVPAEVIAWVDDPIDKFFLQIQGSGVVTLPNGKTLRVGYAGKNGHPYYAVGRELIARGALNKENVSLQTIRKWMQDNPDEAQDLKHLNRSYVFFRKLETNGPVGAQGVVLTPHRSLAVDKNLFSYGLPIWLSAQHPTLSGYINRLMIAQDTGGAIRGAVRGDYFWGHGEHAEQMAGPMKSKGRYWVLLPN